MSVIKRCDVCGWPLKERIEDGCVEGNCSQRPLPKTRWIDGQAAVPIGTAPLPEFVEEKWREWLNVLIEAGIRGHRATETREQVIGLMGYTYVALKMARAELTTARSTISELQKLAEAVGAWVARPAGPSADNSLEIAFHQFRRRTPTTTGNTE